VTGQTFLGSIAQGVSGGIVVALAFAAVAFALDRDDVRPLVHRVRRHRGREERP
jgi:hypothetical protein